MHALHNFFLTFVNIPYNARIVNRSRDEICTIIRPIEIQDIFAVKSNQKNK